MADAVSSRPVTASQRKQNRLARAQSGWRRRLMDVLLGNTITLVLAALALALGSTAFALLNGGVPSSATMPEVKIPVRSFAPGSGSDGIASRIFIVVSSL